MGKFTPLVGTSPVVRNLSNCVAVSDTGYIAAGQHDGERTQPLIVFYDPATGKSAVSYSVPLKNLRGLAYHPTNHSLYAIDHASESNGGGVYRIDDHSEPGKPACKAVKIIEVDFATDLAFAPDGKLYVTTAGENEGKLLRITGDL